MGLRLQVSSFKFQVSRKKTRYLLPTTHYSLLFLVSCLLLAAFNSLPLSLLAQKSKPVEPTHKLVFHVKDCDDEKMLLAIHYRDKYILKDSAYNNGKCSFIFEGQGKYDDGMYSLVSGRKKALILNFLIDGEQKFTYHLDTTGNMSNFSVAGSPENAEMLRFQQKNLEGQRKMSEWGNQRKEFETQENKDSADFYLKKMMNFSSEMEQFIDELINRNPSFLFSKLQKSYRDIEVPEPPVQEDGTIDSSFQVVYLRTHYWDNFDLTDSRFLFLPSYDYKLNDYYKKWLMYQEVDTINKYMDLMIEKVKPDSLMYRFLIEYLTKEFHESKILGHDAVFVHLAKNNQLANKCPWIDEDLMKNIKMRVEDLEPMLIGKKTVELVLCDTIQADHGNWYSSYNMPKKYRILWFYDHTCHTCQKESKELKAVYDSLAHLDKLNFDVYAVNRTDDIAKWKKYIRDNDFSWINVGGTMGNVDWTKEYHITSNPQLYIINQERNIILNKDIPKNLIPKFLQDYERIEAEKARLKNNKR